MNNIVQNKKYSISTPKGFEPFSSIRKISNRKTLNVSLTNNFNISCTHDHKVFSKSFGYVEISFLKVGDNIETRDGYKQIVSIIENEKLADVYDIIDSGIDSCYWTDDILSHNCNFLGSIHTLIHPTKLRELAFITPSRDKWGLDIYERPKENHIYMTVADTSHGAELDYSAFSVIDVTAVPFVQVAKYRSNVLAPLLYPEVLANYGRMYNNAYLLVETNDIGQQVVDTLHQDLEYENILSTAFKGRGGQSIAGVFSRKTSYGVKMTKQVKRIGCSNLKDIIENNKLFIQDYDTIDELSTFIVKGSSYQAEEGCHDDLVMGLVMFAWLAKQPYFKELTDMDIRKRLSDEKIKEMESDLMPAGFIDDGQSEDGNSIAKGSSFGEFDDSPDNLVKIRLL